MDKAELLKAIRKDMLLAKRHFQHYEGPMLLAESFIEAGFTENKLNNPYIQNALNTLASFITNRRVRNIIKYLEEGLREERKNEQNKN